MREAMPERGGGGRLDRTSVAGGGGRAALAPFAQTYGMTPLKPVSNERPDDKNGNRQQPDIPTRPERGIVHDDFSSLCAGSESKPHTVVCSVEEACRRPQKHS